MTTLVRIVLLSLLCIPAAPASAGTFNLIARLSVGTVSGFDFGYTAVGAATGVLSEGGGIAQVPGGLFPATLAGLVSPPQSGVDNFTVTGAGLPAGTLDAAATANVLPLQGNFHPRAGGNLAGTIPMSPIGGGGSATGMLLGIFSATLVAEPWQLGVHTLTGSGLGAGTVMVTGFDLRTALGLGVIQFVSPQTATIPQVPVTIPSGSILQLVYVPVAEPATLGLFALSGIGAAGAALRGRRMRGARDS